MRRSLRPRPAAAAGPEIDPEVKILRQRVVDLEQTVQDTFAMSDRGQRTLREALDMIRELLDMVRELEATVDALQAAPAAGTWAPANAARKRNTARLAQRAQEMRDEGHTAAEIAAKIDRSKRRVRDLLRQ